MPKTTKYPRLRTLVRKGANGQRWVYYYYDMRPGGKPDVPLGKDYAAALVKWDEIHNKKPRIKGTVEEAFAEWEEKVLPSYTNASTKTMYAKGLRWLRPVFGRSTWAAVKLPHLIRYLEARQGKTQANRDMSTFQVIWNYARKRGMTELPWPAAGMEKSGWKNKEFARKAAVSDTMFAMIYAEGDQLLRDAMDLASATSMRITDVRTVPLPHGDILHLEASKTGKEADFDVSLSAVLPDLLARRRANKKAEHLMLLAAPKKRPVSYRQLHDRYTVARAAAVSKARAAGDEALADALAKMILRDCRKYAADQATSLEEAQQLLQHNDAGTTRRHYRSEVAKLKPVR
ncbi:integrase [Hydrogenophaga sp.]|uniref:integrase n=1 Tax=Hydrogenophaga sp. TaxID=1904254 RepID=UPI0025B7C395|nr:integrase [Hydrogenophaga sp.]